LAWERHWGYLISGPDILKEGIEKYTIPLRYFLSVECKRTWRQCEYFYLYLSLTAVTNISLEFRTWHSHGIKLYHLCTNYVLNVM
jgi:hypothetical protein